MIWMVVCAGLTAEMAAESARQKAWDVASRAGAEKSAKGRSDVALVDFFPKIAGLASYTRLSPIEQPLLVPGFEEFRFPVILDNWLFQLSATVPVSDYVLRLVQGYKGYSSQHEAARLDRQAAERKAAADARLAFYAWAKSLVQKSVAEQAHTIAKENFKDAERLFAVGRSSKADMLQLQSRLAAAELAERQAEQAVLVAAEQLRRTARLEEATLEMGEDLSAALPALEVNETALMSAAVETRPELKVVTHNQEGAKQLLAANRALYYPRLEAFGSLNYANPNPRFIPQEARFRLTWDVGARLTWTFNDTFTAIGRVREAEGRYDESIAQAGRVKDALHLEIRNAVTEVRNADAAVVSADTAFAAAEESFRARRELFRQGRATSTELLTAEVDVARAKLSAASARIDQRQSRARLDYASGK